MNTAKSEHKVMLHKDNTIEFSWTPGPWGATYNVSPSPFNGMTVYTNYGTAHIIEFDVWHELRKRRE